MSMLITDIIDAIRRRAAIPNTDASGFASTDILEWIQSTLDDNVYPVMTDVCEEYFVDRISLPLSTSGVSNFPSWSVPLPSRCLAWNLREIKTRDLSGNVYNIPLINLEDVESATIWGMRISNRVPGFHFVNDAIQLVYGGDLLTGWLDLQYLLKPSALSVSTTLCKDITKVNTVGLTTTLTIDSSTSTDLDAYCTSVGGATAREFDIFKKSTGAYVKVNAIMTRATATTFTMTLTDSSTLPKFEPWVAGFTTNSITDLANSQRGGFGGTGGAITTGYIGELVLCPAGQNTRSPLPPEGDQLLIAAATGRYLEAMGDVEGLNVVKAQEAVIHKNLLKMFGKRISGECKVFSNRRGFLRYMSAGRGGSGF